MTGPELTASQVQLLKARATRYSQFKQQKLSAEHGTLAKEIDQCLAYGLVSTAVLTCIIIVIDNTNGCLHSTSTVYYECVVYTYC